MKTNIVYLFALLLAFMSLVLCPVGANAEELEPGLYYLAPDGPQLIESQSCYTTSGGFGTSRGQMQVGVATSYQSNFSGPEADMKTSTTPEFLFVYNPQAKIVLINNNVFNCKQTSDPNLAVLLRLEQRNNKRVLDVANCDWYSIDTLLIQPLDEYRYQMRIQHPLSPGEYGFVFQMPGLGGMLVPLPDRVWAFSVKDTLSAQRTDSLPAILVSSSSPISSVTAMNDHSSDPSDVGVQYNIDLTGDLTYNPTLVSGDYTSSPYTSGGVSIGAGAGIKMNRFFYFGAAFDFTGEWGKTTLTYMDEWECPVRLSNWVLPIYANTRVYWPNKSICTPFWDMQIGGYMGLFSRVTTDIPDLNADEQLACYIPKNGFYFSTGLGINLAMFTIGVGYKLFHQSSYNCNYAYFKLGVSIFKPMNLYRKK